jgi:hypothetical protein
MTTTPSLLLDSPPAQSTVITGLSETLGEQDGEKKVISEFKSMILTNTLASSTMKFTFL